MSSSNVNSQVVVHYDSIIKESVAEFNKYAKKSVESVLEMGRVVYQAKTLLEQGGNKEGFSEFCEHIGFKSGSSTIKKYICIGKSYAHLVTGMANLPNNWTTIYQISQMDPVRFGELIANGEISPSLTGAGLKKLVNKNTSTSTYEYIDDKVCNVDEVIDCERVEKIVISEKVLNRTPIGCEFVCEFQEINDQVIKDELVHILESLERMGAKVKIGNELKQALKPSAINTSISLAA